MVFRFAGKTCGKATSSTIRVQKTRSTMPTAETIVFYQKSTTAVECDAAAFVCQIIGENGENRNILRQRDLSEIHVSHNHPRQRFSYMLIPVPVNSRTTQSETKKLQ
eukprot:scpid55218/ scgid27492/ 